MFSGAKLDKFPGSQLLDLFGRASSSAPNTPAHSSKGTVTTNSKPSTPAHSKVRLLNVVALCCIAGRDKNFCFIPRLRETFSVQFPTTSLFHSRCFLERLINLILSRDPHEGRTTSSLHCDASF